MKLFTPIAAVLAIATANPIYRPPVEAYQNVDYQQYDQSVYNTQPQSFTASDVSYKDHQDHQAIQSHQLIQSHHGLQAHPILQTHHDLQNSGLQGHQVIQNVHEFQNHGLKGHQVIHPHHDLHSHGMQSQQVVQGFHHSHGHDNQGHQALQGHGVQNHQVIQSQGHGYHQSINDLQGHNSIQGQDHHGHQERQSGQKPAKILRYQAESDKHNYQFAYETENGIKAQEIGSTEGKGSRAQGGYSYTGDDGKVYTVTYTADENGFHAQGAHIPTPPPVPEAIAKSLEQNAKEEANGVYNDGQYQHEQEQQQHQVQGHQQDQGHQQYQQYGGGYQQNQQNGYKLVPAPVTDHSHYH